MIQPEGRQPNNTARRAENLGCKGLFRGFQMIPPCPCLYNRAWMPVVPEE